MDGRDENELARLMRAANAGDERAYASFLLQVAGLVRGFARRKVQGGIDPEDIVQETLLAIHMKRHTWRDDAPVTPWVYAITRYKLVDAFRRRRRRRVEVEMGEIPESFAQPEPETVNGREIARALETLAPGQRSAVAAVCVDGHSIGETAKRLGMSETAVRVALHRGLTAIARRFGRN